MKKTFLILAAFLGLLGVIAGALGAHALKNVMDVEALSAYKTAVLYQMLHVLVVLLLPALSLSEAWRNRSASLFLFGMVLFPGSIYLFTVIGFEPGLWGLVAPSGGLLMMGGWLAIAWGLFKSN